MRLTFHHRVQREVNEAVDWYNEQREGLGDEFFQRLSEVLEIIAVRPKSFGFWLSSPTVRGAKLKRFPYSALFEMENEHVKVLCVRHEKRHPSFGLGRR